MIDPISIGLLIGGAALGIGIALYWKQIKGWLGRVWQALSPLIKEAVQGMVTFVQKLWNTAKNIAKYYSYDQNTKQWHETIVTTEVDESTVPDKIRAKLGYDYGNEVETTDELELALKG